MAPIHSIGTYTRREGHRANVCCGTFWLKCRGGLLLFMGPVCSSADHCAWHVDAEYVVEWYSLTEEGWIEFSRHNTRAEAQQTRDRLFDIIAEVGVFSMVRITVVCANALERASR